MKKLEPYVEYHGQIPTLFGGNDEKFFEYTENRTKIKTLKEVLKLLKTDKTKEDIIKEIKG